MFKEAKDAPEPGRAADTAGAACGLGAIYPANALRPVGKPAMRNLHAILTTQHSWRSTGWPHAHCLAAVSPRRPPRSRRLPTAQLTPGVRRQESLLKLELHLKKSEKSDLTILNIRAIIAPQSSGLTFQTEGAGSPLD